MAADLPADGGVAPTDVARLHDPDRFLTALFAPSSMRERLFVLIAFNHELVRALEMSASRATAGPMAALIRLQWWRDVIEGRAGGHELAAPLSRLLGAGSLPRAALLALIEAREAEAEGFGTMQAWRDAMLAGPGGFQVAFAEALGETDPGLLARLRRIGAAYGAGAMLRHLPALLRTGREPLPADRPANTTGWLRDAGRGWLLEAGAPRLNRERRAAGLIRVLAARDLSRDAGLPERRGLGDRLAVTLASLRAAP
nr:squalene/phytoene synthase family protein [uncultured Lichenicoccus sp.]